MVPSILGAWNSAAQSLIKDAAGNVVDVIYWIFGGGHGDTGYDGVVCWRASTGTFEVLLDPTTWIVHGVADIVHGEDVPNRPASQHTYQHIYGLNSDEPGGPALVQLRGYAVGQGASPSGQSHIFNLATKTWSRLSDGVMCAGNAIAACIKDTKRKRFIAIPCNNGQDLSTLDYTNSAAKWVTTIQTTNRVGGWDDSYEATGIYDPIGDIYLVGHWFEPISHGLVWYDPDNLKAGGTPINETGAKPTNIRGCGLQYVAATDEFLLMYGNQPTDVYRLKPPPLATRKTGAWIWTKQTFAGPASVFSNAADPGQQHNRWQYVDALGALIVCPMATAPMEAWSIASSSGRSAGT
jgi:hypothetical protein